MCSRLILLSQVPRLVPLAAPFAGGPIDCTAIAEASANTAPGCRTRRSFDDSRQRLDGQTAAASRTSISRNLMRSLMAAIVLSAFCWHGALAQSPPLEDRYADVNGVRLHYVTQGTGRLIIFLHGFPEFWYQWKPQLAEFSKDFQVVAPDMRGYNLSSKPAGVDHYQVKILVEDIRLLAERLGQRQIILVGQDWGGVIAWAFALYHPDLVEKLIVLNAPHPAIFDREMKENPAQQLASRYMVAVRDPAAAQSYPPNDYAALVGLVLAEGLRKGRFVEADKRAYINAWSQPGALDSALNYYRAAHIGPADPATGSPANGNYTPDLSATIVHVPTLLIWGLQDPYLLAGNLSGIGKYVPDLTLKLLPDATHWVNHEKPDEVNTAIRKFITAH
jgi:epoxide hydrolase 4